MLTRSTRCNIGLMLLLTLALLPVLAVAPEALAEEPCIIPPNKIERCTGMTYGEWNAAWWQWAFSQHAIGGPLYDWTGAQADKGQSGRVWFLAGIQGVEFAPQTNPATVHRTITIPEKTYVFVPILNAEASFLEGQGTTEQELMDYVAWVLTIAEDMEFTVDGKTLGQKELRAYGAVAPELFSICMPEGNNLELEFGVDHKALPEPVDGVVTVDNCAASGYSVMVAPLAAGKHTIHFKGAFVLDEWSFALDITYDITVVPEQR